MYAGTIIEYVDLSDIPAIETVTEEKPFYVAAFSSEKGTEDPLVVEGKDFYKMFVTPDPTQANGYFIPFEKHGQPLLQAANIIDAGGKIYAKRVVAKDATLANIVVYATVTKGKAQKTINTILGETLPVYWGVNSEGERIEVIEPTNAEGKPNEPVMIDVAKIMYTANTVEGASNIDAIVRVSSENAAVVYKYTAGEAGLTAGTYAFADEKGLMYEFTIGEDMVKDDIIVWNGTTANLEYTVNGVSKATTISMVETTSSTQLVPELSKTLPLLVVTDNGRGESKKKIKIIPNYEYSKTEEFMIYNFQVIEEGNILDSKIVALDSTKQYLSQNISIKNQFKGNKSQIKASFNEASYTELINTIAEYSGKDATEVAATDILNGMSLRGEPVDFINIEAGSFDLQYVYGILLQSGTNGAFGSNPMETDEYVTELVEFFNGTYTDDIYDVDNLKFDFIVDANYPPEVKSEIENFVKFREDCFFFCDFGTNIRNYGDVANMVQNARHADTKFVGYYETSYDIIDPYTQKQINVTIMYDMAALLVPHFHNGRIRPVAGQMYGFVFPNAIEGTVNYIPKIVPSVNQKQLMNDIRVNYATYYDGVLTLDSEYTSQQKHTQFSYINNILGVQEVVKAIRTRCPKIRYSFIGQEGLIKYKDDVDSTVIDRYRANFDTLELVYLGDSTYEANKIFYAGINVRFRDFVQTEIFKVYALR